MGILLLSVWYRGLPRSASIGHLFITWSVQLLLTQVNLLWYQGSSPTCRIVASLWYRGLPRRAALLQVFGTRVVPDVPYCCKFLVQGFCLTCRILASFWDRGLQCRDVPYRSSA